MIRLQAHDTDFLDYVNEKSGTNILECYQCGKCTGTCPMSAYMDIPPRKVMQYLKLGQKDRLLNARSMWYCLACSSCSARCPRSIDIPQVMEVIRHKIIEEKIENPSQQTKNIQTFHEIFFDMIKKYGRLYELRLMAEFNVRTRQFFKDFSLAPKTFLKGKIGIFPVNVQNKKAMKKLFEAAERIDKQTRA